MSRTCPRVLIVEDDPEYLQALEQALAREFSVIGASSIEQAHGRLNSSLDVVLLDVRLSEEEGKSKEGLRLLGAIQQILPQVPIVMMTAYGDIDLAVEAMQLGAADFVQKARVDIRGF